MNGWPGWVVTGDLKFVCPACNQTFRSSPKRRCRHCGANPQEELQRQSRRDPGLLRYLQDAAEAELR